MSKKAANTKRLGIFTAQLAIAAGLLVTTQASALGVGDECARRPGFLVFIDRGANMTRGHCAGVSGTNAYWGNFTGNWANRADEFRNDGNTHNACIFEFSNFNRERFFPDSRFLFKNEIAVWYDEVESNAWTTGDGC